MYYGLGLPRSIWMEDQLQFELLIEKMSVRHA